MLLSQRPQGPPQTWPWQLRSRCGSVYFLWVPSLLSTESALLMEVSYEVSVVKYVPKRENAYVIKFSLTAKAAQRQLEPRHWRADKPKQARRLGEAASPVSGSLR